MFVTSRRIAAAVFAPTCLIVVSAMAANPFHCQGAEQPAVRTPSGWSTDPPERCSSGTTIPHGHTFFQAQDCEETPFTDRLKSTRRRISWKHSTSHCGRLYVDNPPYHLPNFGYYQTNWRPAFMLCNEPAGRILDEYSLFETPPLKVPTPASPPDDYSPPTDVPAELPASVPGGHSTAH